MSTYHQDAGLSDDPDHDALIAGGCAMYAAAVSYVITYDGTNADTVRMLLDVCGYASAMSGPDIAFWPTDRASRLARERDELRLIAPGQDVLGGGRNVSILRPGVLGVPGAQRILACQDWSEPCQTS